MTTVVHPRPQVLSPVAEQERITLLDILRAVALFGVFLMNVEFFTRPLESVGRMVEPGLSGLDHTVAWIEYVFMHGKFWTMFSLLFGMGFAVMLERAEHVGRAFEGPYLRRLAALFAMGAAHAVLIWAGDILHSYAIAACVLLLMLRGRWWWLLLFSAVFLLIQLVWGSSRLLFTGMISCLVYAGVGALLQSRKRGGEAGAASDFIAWLPWLLMSLAMVSCVLWLRSPGFVPQACMVSFTLLAAVSTFLREPGCGRIWRAGAAIYAILPLAISAMTLLGSLQPDSAAPARNAEIEAAQAAGIAHAAVVSAGGNYAENVALRWNFLWGEFGGELYLVMSVVGMFLIGVWFVRSGAMRDVAAHRGLFRRLAWVGLPAGIALALLSAAVGTTFDPQQREQGILAINLMQIANPVLSLGYVGAVVLFVHGARGALRLGWLAPVGRMALTNYLTQSIVGTLIFYGYGLGLWGRIDRVGQLLLVVAIFAMQALYSRWWFMRFHFGPMEWLWRAVTYAHWPVLVRRPAVVEAAVASEKA